MIKIFKLLFQLWPQCFATLTVSLVMISNGLAYGWSSPYLAQLTSENGPFRITDEEASWIVSLLSLGRLLGAVSGSLIVEYISSKISILISGLPIMFSWICMICATSPIWLYVGRIFAGMSMGMIISSYSFYIGEISAPSIRGVSVNLIFNGLFMGTFLGTVMGSSMSIMFYGITSLILTLCFMGIFPFFPQTPYYYVQRNDTKKAEQVIQWYYRKSDIRSEMEAVENFMKSRHAMNMKERLKQIKDPKNRHSFIIIIIISIFAQFCGVNTILFYMEIIVRKAMVTSITPSILVIIINAIGLIFGWMGAFAIDYYGRRIVSAISSFGVMMGMTLLGLHLFLLENNYNPSDFEWLLILSLLMIMLMNFGLMLMPCTMMSEIFPSELKSVAGFIASIVNAIFAFVTSKTYQPLIDLIGEKYLNWIYAVIMMISLIYTIIALPETKGKTLAEIQDMLAAKNITKKSQQQKMHLENI